MQFKKIIEFTYCHDYFEAGSMPSLFSIEPLAQSRELMNDYGFIFRQTNNGFYMAAKCSDSNGHVTAPPKENLVTVALYAIDPYLLNYTELPYIKPSEKLFYGSNLSGVVVEANNVLTSATIKSKGVLVNSQPFSVTSILNKSVVGKSQKGGGDNPLFPDPNLYYLNMNKWPDDVYEVSDEKKTASPIDSTTFYGVFAFFGRPLMAKPPMALLTFTLPDVSTTEATSQSIQYSMALTARSVFWQYQFSKLPNNRLTVNTEHATLVSQPDTRPKPEFKTLDIVKKIILSNTAIKLTQAPWLGLELTSGTDTPVINNLPNPQVENVYPCIVPGYASQPDLPEGSFYADIPVKLSISSAVSSPASGTMEAAINE